LHAIFQKFGMQILFTVPFFRNLSYKSKKRGAFEPKAPFLSIEFFNLVFPSHHRQTLSSFLLSK